MCVCVCVCVLVGVGVSSAHFEHFHFQRSQPVSHREVPFQWLIKICCVAYRDEGGSHSHFRLPLAHTTLGWTTYMGLSTLRGSADHGPDHTLVWVHGSPTWGVWLTTMVQPLTLTLWALLRVKLTCEMSDFPLSVVYLGNGWWTDTEWTVSGCNWMNCFISLPNKIQQHLMKAVMYDS